MTCVSVECERRVLLEMLQRTLELLDDLAVQIVRVMEIQSRNQIINSEENGDVNEMQDLFRVWFIKVPPVQGHRTGE